MELRPGDSRAARRLFWWALRLFGGANTVGALMVFLYFILAPAGEGIDGPNAPGTIAVFVAFLSGALVAGGLWAWRRLTSAAAWLPEDRDATPHERRATVALPWTFALAGFRFWVLASAVCAW